MLAPHSVLDHPRQGSVSVMAEASRVPEAAGHGSAVPVGGKHDYGMWPPLEERNVFGDKVGSTGGRGGRSRPIGERGR